MPPKQFFLWFAAGLTVIGGLVLGSLWLTRGAHLELTGEIRKVRTQPMDEKSAVAIIDLHFTNPSDLPFVVRTVAVTLEDKAGAIHEGRGIAEVDVLRLFQYFPVLGPKYNDSLKPRDRLPAGQTLDRMVAARFEIPASALDSRAKVTVRVTEVDGVWSELSETNAGTAR